MERMNICLMKSTATVTAATLVLFAGTAIGAEPLTTNDPRTPETRAPERPDREGWNQNERDRTLHFTKASALMDKSVVNTRGETVANVSDVIVNRGNGRVEFVVVSAGGLLGLGDRQIAVPYDQIGFDVGEERFTLNVPEDMLEDDDLYMPDGWIELESGDWEDTLATAYADSVRALDKNVVDPLAEMIRETADEEVEGTIVYVNPTTMIEGSEQVVATVRLGAAETRRVILGPSWFVMSQNAAPRVGEPIRVRGYEVDRMADEPLLARAAWVSGKELKLRDERGTPWWLASDRDRSTAGGDLGVPSSPHVMLSEIVGADAAANDEKDGEVSDAVLEMTSGRIVMLDFDPNEGLLGINDTHRAVPWSIVSMNDDTVRIHSDNATLARCEEMPDDVTVFVSRARLTPVFRVFNMDVIDLEPRERKATGTGTSGG